MAYWHLTWSHEIIRRNSRGPQHNITPAYRTSSTHAYTIQLSQLDQQVTAWFHGVSFSIERQSKPNICFVSKVVHYFQYDLPPWNFIHPSYRSTAATFECVTFHSSGTDAQSIKHMSMHIASPTPKPFTCLTDPYHCCTNVW